MGFERGGGQILGFSIDSRRRPYNTLALPCECVITLVFYCTSHILFVLINVCCICLILHY